MRAFMIALVVAAALPAATAGSDSFRPVEDRYLGHTTRSGAPIEIRVGGYLRPERRELPAVRLVSWRAKLRCPGHRTRVASDRMAAARIGRTFSGFVMFPGGKLSFSGVFTARDALRGSVRVQRRTGTLRCDTGAVRFVARRR